MSWSPSPPPERPKPSPQKRFVKAKEVGKNTSTNVDPKHDANRFPIEPDFSEAPIDLFSTGIPRGIDARPLEDSAESSDTKGRVSMYVRIVDEMLTTVLQDESYLFTMEECNVLNRFKDLNYEPKYLLTRLLLRKTNKIFSVKELIARYSTELGAGAIPGYMDVLIETINSLISPLTSETVVTPGPVSKDKSTESLFPSHVDGTDAFESDINSNKIEVIELSSDSETEVPTTALPEKSSSRIRVVTSKRSKTVKPVLSTNPPLPKQVYSIFNQSRLRQVPNARQTSADQRVRLKSVDGSPSRPEKPVKQSVLEARLRTCATPERPIVVEIPSSPEQLDTSFSQSLRRTFSRPTIDDSLQKRNSARSAASISDRPLAMNEHISQEDLVTFYSFKRRSQITSNFAAFARGIKDLAVEDMIVQLPMVELVAIAKELSLWKSKYNRGELIQALLGSANKQSRLPFAFRTVSGTTKSSDNEITRLARTGRTLLYDKVAKSYGGKAIQILLPFRALINRLNLVYYRSTITPSTGVAKSLMLPEILTSSAKRAYPEVTPTRSRIWPDRDALLDYESALEMEAMVDEALGEQNHSTGNWVGPSGFGFGLKGGRLEGARRVKQAWNSVYDLWKVALQKANEDPDRKTSGSRHILDRFELGHILTRIVAKGARALGILKEYDQEIDVLKNLLAQHIWRRGKRGAWYDRLALINMHHFGGNVNNKRIAVEVCLDALEDVDTHLIYRPRLSRRLKRLERQLELPKDECHICEAELGQPEKRYLKAHRLDTARPRMLSRFSSTSRPESPFDNDTGTNETAEYSAANKHGGSKTSWLGKEGGKGVEAWVLEWWDQEGWKGFHAESSILTTLFALLLWPIIFLPLPGAFETPYQLAPLDLGSDSFYTSRSAVIEKRLADMQKTSDCLAMLKEIDDRERPRGTLAVGVSWGYEANDLREIVECLGGKALSVLCRMFCEEYGHRASGVPDLIVWNYTERRARFVEVKSPNDHLSETQKIWISVLQTAGVEVEVCHVTEIAIDERSSLRGLNKRRSDDEQSELQAKRPKRTTRRGMEEYQQSEYEEENEFDEEMRDEWAYESGNEAKIRSSRGEGVLLSRSQVSQTQGDNIPDKENSPAYFQEGALLIDAKGSSQLEGRIRPASGSIGKAQSIR